MSAEYESDLYEDLYGADDVESPTVKESSEDVKPSENTQESTSSSTTAGTTLTTSTLISDRGGDTPSSASNTKDRRRSQDQDQDLSAASLSYSAQIAKQFSSYSQTPSQERQQRPVMSHITSYESRTQNGALSATPMSAGAGDRPIRPSDMKDEGKMFIGGLSWDTTEESLKEYFSQFGKVDQLTILREADGRSRGFAFLTFEEPSSVTTVLGREHFLDGKSIDPKRAIPRATHLRSQRFFIGGLAPSTTDESLRVFLTQFGKIVDVNVMGDRESGRNKGFGFATFEDLPDPQLEQLTKPGGWDIDGKMVEIKLAQPRAARQNNNPPTRPQSIGTYTSEASNIPVNRSASTSFTPTATPATQDMTALYQRMLGHVVNGGMGMGGMNGMNGMNGMGAMGNMGMGQMGQMGMGAMNGMSAMGMAGMGGNMAGLGMAGMNAGMTGAGGVMMNGMMPGNPVMGMGGMGMNNGMMGAGMNPAMPVPFNNMMGGGMNFMGAGNTLPVNMNAMARFMPSKGRGGGANAGSVGPARVAHRTNQFHPYSRS